MTDLKACVFIGRPGSGKGTQSQSLIEKLKVTKPVRPIIYVETGSLFREFMKGDSYTQRLVREALEKGERLQDFLAIWNWTNKLIKEMTGQEHIIFDGAPRSLLEAQIVSTMAKQYSLPEPTIVYINVSREWAKARLLARGRVDDHDEGINNRLGWFDRDVAPAVTYFREQSDFRFLDINGEQPIERVSADIWSGLGL
ncbi:MAG: nucleoside monophosphate kinase [Patescibacteria group bacterium]|nr:nucleoside monophosphate kinase [Patescibacteria group bacterium]